MILKDGTDTKRRFARNPDFMDEMSVYIECLYHSEGGWKGDGTDYYPSNNVIFIRYGRRIYVSFDDAVTNECTVHTVRYPTEDDAKQYLRGYYDSYYAKRRTW